MKPSKDDKREKCLLRKTFIVDINNYKFLEGFFERLNRNKEHWRFIIFIGISVHPCIYSNHRRNRKAIALPQNGQLYVSELTQWCKFWRRIVNNN